nr:transmembrane emp24 domain containing protein 7 [Hymenolepis microstoma]
MLRLFVSLIVVFFLFDSAESSAYTFELPDGENRCFYAPMEEGEHSTIEFQVISGGNFDVDVILHDPFKNIVKQLEREQYDYFEFTAKVAGEYKLCFGNEFSSVTHKVVYVSWELESQRSQLAGGKPDSPLTMMDTMMYSIHENLRNAAAAQTKVRLQEATSRSFIEALNDRVTWGSIIHAAIIVIVAVGQVYLLRSLFNTPSHASVGVAINRNRVMPTVGY